MFNQTNNNIKYPKYDEVKPGFINDEEYSCPIYFSNHDWGGTIREIENFTNVYFDFNIRSTLLNGKPYFCSNDVLKCLNMDTNNSRNTVSRVINDLLQSEYAQLQDQSDINSFENELYFYINLETDVINQHGATGNKQIVRTMFISEPVLYTLIFRSNKQEAVNLRAWLSIEVLPKMRSIGRERTDRVLSIMNDLATQGKLDTILDLLQNLNDNAVSKDEVFRYATNFNNIIGNSTKTVLDNQYYNTAGILYNQNMIYDQTVKTASGLNAIFGK